MNKSNVPQLKFEEFLYNWGTTKKIPLEAKFEEPSSRGNQPLIKAVF
jgi:hypothetical protein